MSTARPSWLVLAVLGSAAFAHAQPQAAPAAGQAPAAEPPKEPESTGFKPLGKPEQVAAPNDQETVVAPKFGLAPVWQVQLQPSIWFTSPGGQLTMPGTSIPGVADPEETELEDLNVNSPRLSPFGKVHLRWKNWQVGFMGFGYSIDRDTGINRDARIGDLFVAPGDNLRTSLDFSSFEATGAYRLLESNVVRSADGYARVIASLDGIFGARLYDLNYEVTLTPGDSPRASPLAPPAMSTSADEFFAEPLVGLKGELEIYESITVNVQLTAGYGPWGDNESVSWDVMAGFAWRPVENVGLQIGYRQLAFDLQSGDGSERFEHSGSLAGLYFGLFIRF